MNADESGWAAVSEVGADTLRAGFGAVSDAVVILEPTGRIDYANAAARSRYGDEELGGRSIDALADGATDTPLVERLLEAADADRTVSWTVRTNDGDRRAEELHPTPTRVGGEPRLLVVARDQGSIDADQPPTEPTPAEPTPAEQRDLFAHGPAVVFKWGAAEGWPVEYVSENVADVFGYTPAELRSGDQPFADRIHSADLDRVEAELAATDDAGIDRFCHDPYRIRTADGEWRWVLDYSKALREDGEITHWIGYLLDITDQRRTEASLETAQDVADVGWWYTEIPADRIHWSDKVGSMWGLDADTLDRAAVLERVHPDDRARVEAAWAAAKRGETYDVDHRIVTPAGETKWMRQRADVVYEDGTAVSATGVVQDITDQRRREDDLKRARSELRQIVDLIPDPVFAKNRDGDYLLANEALADCYGETPATVEGRHESDVLPDAAQSEAFREDDLAVIDSGEPAHIPEEPLTTADGETRIFETVKIPYETAGDGEPAVLAYARDITDLKASEHLLETQRDNLDVLNQVVRHDIRNDLQLISAYAEMLDGTLDAESQAHLDVIARSADNAIELTTTARDLAETMLQADATRRPMPLARILDAQIDRLLSAEPTTVVSVTGELPRVRVLADDLLEAVFRNLLKNAVQHNDTEEPEISIETAVGDGTITVRITDNGPGVSDAHKTQIFGRGEQGLDSSGTGIGLYLVDTLVDRYGGDIRVEDNEPRGAVFVVDLPLAD